ncbi:hypothetical protein GH733_013544 [Mirounga leonina]|nr:hypothetical protein GH733_013544 [Mirounga leonina]
MRPEVVCRNLDFLTTARPRIAAPACRILHNTARGNQDRDFGVPLLRSTCTLSHDIHTPVNIQVLKNHGLFGLNEAQLRILLLQNDPCLLPEVCLLYNKGEALYGYCNLKDKCNKFHVCKSFVRGECRLQKCKRSHQLIHATALKLLQDQGLNIPSVVNFQIISTYKHMKLHKMLENQDNAASAQCSQGPEKPGVHVAGAAEASPVASMPAQSAKKPHAAKP